MIVLIFCLSILAYSDGSPWDTLTANIAVVEYQPLQNNSFTAEDRVTQNSLQYIQLLKSLNVELDLIIFPESALEASVSTAVEIRDMEDIPCGWVLYPDFMSNLSCAAAEAQTFMVVNLVEKVKCNESDQSPNCKTHGFKFYNCDLVLNRAGAIVERYRKYNLFGEHDKDKPEKADAVVVETDFGVKLGIFTCFDILFKSPAQDLAEEGVDGVIFPTMWFSELPFLTALQAQQMWSYAHDVTLFSAGANNPSRGSGGTAVHRGTQGTVYQTIVAQGGSQAYLYESIDGRVTPPAEEDVDSVSREMDSVQLLTDNSLPDFLSVPLNTSDENYEAEVCHGEDENQFCCKLTLKSSFEEPDPNFESYTYHLVIYSGIRSYSGVYNGGIEVCGVIACLNSSLTSCGQRFPQYEKVQWPVTFEEITILARYQTSDNKTYFPDTLLSTIRPIDATETEWGEEIPQNDGKSATRTFSLKKPQNRLLTFAVYGRNFARDSPPDSDDDNSASSVNIASFLLSFILLLSVV
ncbi:vanin-like protein 1 [Tenebrio molitor]|jgi:pantetheine hydrolase|uniref:CN hydrolase domain-containing protein n=1 Tax=Tenebrio molitor TaxID=7067 RepID=A0A8J6LFN9_TENMO|nr:hypothetical protein GEV33_005328 [Tenebrio molitor]